MTTPDSAAALPPQPVARKPRGFAAIAPELRRKIASMGGKKAQAIGVGNRFDAARASAAAKVAHQRGTAHQFTSEEARAAGRKGGRAKWLNRRQATPHAATTPISETSGSVQAK